MTETKKRTSTDVQSDYNNLAFRAGHLQLEIFNKQKEIKLFNETLESLRLEFTKLKNEEDEAAKTVETK